MAISDDRDRRLGELTQDVNDEFVRQRDECGDAIEAARRMDAYVDKLATKRRGDRFLSDVLAKTKAGYRDLARRT